MIKVENLRKNFGTFTAVDGLNFEVPRTGVFGLLGPNGAGKTTTISMICGLLHPTGGKIILDTSSGKDFKALIGYCPQENIFYPKLTCLEQLLFIGSIYVLSGKTLKSRAIELLSVLGLKDKTHTLAASLSGGMKRRLNICLALIHNPEILILDEPEAGLDPQSRILVRDFIKSFGKEKTTILTTHNMDEADRLADLVAIMDHGKLLLLDTPSNLKRKVGEGDILEIVTSSSDPGLLDKFAEQIKNIPMDVTRGTDSVMIKHQHIIESVPAIKNLAEKIGLAIIEIKLRENTLEDVFIHLTGRNLRQ